MFPSVLTGYVYRICDAGIIGCCGQACDLQGGRENAKAHNLQNFPDCGIGIYGVQEQQTIPCDEACALSGR